MVLSAVRYRRMPERFSAWVYAVYHGLPPLKFLSSETVEIFDETLFSLDSLFPFCVIYVYFRFGVFAECWTLREILC